MCESKLENTRSSGSKSYKVELFSLTKCYEGDMWPHKNGCPNVKCTACLIRLGITDIECLCMLIYNLVKMLINFLWVYLVVIKGHFIKPVT